MFSSWSRHEHKMRNHSPYWLNGPDSFLCQAIWNARAWMAHFTLTASEQTLFSAKVDFARSKLIAKNVYI